MADQINFRYQFFFVVSVSPGGKVPIVDDMLSSHELQFYPTASLDESSIEFEFQTDYKLHVDLRQKCLPLKPKLVVGRDFDIYKKQKRERNTKKAMFSLKQATMTSYY